MPVEERFWKQRLRWRLRGASWLWPAYFVAVLFDAAVLHLLPPVGSEHQVNAPTGLNLVGDLILAGFTNLFLIAVIAPWFARRLEARPVPDHALKPPYELFYGRSAAILMALGSLGLIVVGLGNRPVIVSETKATQTNAQLVENYVFNHGSAEMRRNLETANTVRLSTNFFRTCISNDHRTSYWCFFVDTKADPAKLTVDHDRRPNSVVAPDASKAG